MIVRLMGVPHPFLKVSRDWLHLLRNSVLLCALLVVFFMYSNAPVIHSIGDVYKAVMKTVQMPWKGKESMSVDVSGFCFHIFLRPWGEMLLLTALKGSPAGSRGQPL